MPTLYLPRPRAAQLAPPLPVNNRVLNGAGLAFRRGQFSIMAAAPGVGKSVFATNLALRAKVPTLFLSADSDEWTVMTRACSILSGVPLATVEDNLNEESWQDWYGGLLMGSEHVDWCFQSRIDIEFICNRILAFEEIYGEPPQLVVVDNLKNTVMDPERQYAELEGICLELQEVARLEQCHVLALHHVKGAKEDGRSPIGLGDLLGNIDKIPEVVLGLNWPNASRDSLTLTVPKNRGGPSGQHLYLDIDYSRATVGGFG
jgi:replicative DNA helicase